jgi:hypothetical protein
VAGYFIARHRSSLTNVFVDRFIANFTPGAVPSTDEHPDAVAWERAPIDWGFPTRLSTRPIVEHRKVCEPGDRLSRSRHSVVPPRQISFRS